MKNRLKSLFISFLCFSMVAGYSLPMFANDDVVDVNDQTTLEEPGNNEQPTVEGGDQNQDQTIPKESQVQDFEKQPEPVTPKQEEVTDPVVPTPTQVDTTEPVLEKLELKENGQTVEGGSTITITANAYDADSAIQSVYVSFVSYNDDSVVGNHGVMLNHVSGKIYSGTYQVEKYNVTKVLLNNIEIIDAVGNVLNEYVSDQNQFVNVNPSTEEIPEPKITNITFDNNHGIIQQNDYISLQVYTENTNSVSNVRAVFESEEGYIFEGTTYYAMDNCFDLQVYLHHEPDLKLGNHKFELKKVEITKIDNTIILPSIEEFKPMDFTLEMLDVEKPIITDFQMTKQGEVVKAGDTINFALKATDGGELQSASLSFSAVDSSDNFHISLDWNQDKKLFEGSYTISEDDYPTEWVLDNVWVYDVYGNNTDGKKYFTGENRYSNFYFMVTGEGAHVIPTYDVTISFNNPFEYSTYFEDQTQYQVQRRTTFKEAGFDLNKTPQAPFDDLNFVSWCYNGELVNEDTEIVPQYTSSVETVYMELYPKFDKNIVRLDISYLNKNGYMKHVNEMLAIDHSMTYGELEKYLNSGILNYDDIDSEMDRWNIPSYYAKNDTVGLNDGLSIEAVISNKIIATVSYKYLNNKGQYKWLDKRNYYDKDITYKELYEDIKKEQKPTDYYDSLDFSGWKVERESNGTISESIVDIDVEAVNSKCFVRYVVDSQFKDTDSIPSHWSEYPENYDYVNVEVYDKGTQATIPEAIGKYKNIKLKTSTLGSHAEKLVPGYTFTVNDNVSFYGYNQTEDTTEPVFEKIELVQNGQTVDGGSEIEINVYAYDEDNEINDVRVDIYHDNNLCDYVELKHVEGNKYQAIYRVREYGVKKANIESIYISDNESNSINKYFGPNQYFVNINSKEFDKEINIKNINFEGNHKTFKQNDQTKISITFAEPQYIEDNVNFIFKNDEGKEFRITNSYSSDDRPGEFVSNIYLNSSELYGLSEKNHKFTLETISLRRVDGKFIKLNVSDLGSFDFNVDIKDLNRPEITDFTMTHQKETVTVGDTIDFKVKVVDDSNLSDSGSITIHSIVLDYNNDYRNVDVFYDSKEKAYFGTYTVNENDTSTEWIVESIHVEDEYGNQVDESRYFKGENRKSNYYFNVDNGGFKEISYNLTVNFHKPYITTESNIKSQHKKNVKRRSTFKEAGFDLSQIEKSPVEGIDFVGWETYDGTLITEDTEVIPDFVHENGEAYCTLYPRFDKNIITSEVTYLNKGNKVVYKENEKIAIPHGITYAELDKYLDENLIYSDMEVNGSIDWKLPYSDPNVIVPRYAYINIEIPTEDKIMAVFGFQYLNKDGLFKSHKETMLLDAGTKYEDIPALIEKQSVPEDLYEGIGFNGWEYYDGGETGVIPTNTISRFSASAKRNKLYVRFIIDDRFAIGTGIGGTSFTSEEFEYSYVELYDKGDVAKVPSTIGKYDLDKIRFAPMGQGGIGGTEENVKPGYEFTVNEDITRYGYVIDEEPPFEPGDKTRLQNLLNEAKKLDSSLYTTKSWQVVEGAIKEANEVLASEGVSQDVIDLAYEKLYNAMKSLEKIPVEPEVPVNKTELNNVIKEAKQLDSSLYTKDSWDRVDEALKKAEKVLLDETTTQEFVNQAIIILNEAISKLVEDITKLPEDKIDEVVENIGKAEAGSKVEVEMNDATVVPEKVLEEVKGKDVDVTLDMKDYTWTINGKDVLSEDLKDINLEVKFDTNAIPDKVVSQIAGDKPVKQLSLTHEGHFGFKGTLTFYMGKEYAGKQGALYYYDSAGKMILQNTSVIDENGYASFMFNHASDYMVVIEEKGTVVDPEEPTDPETPSYPNKPENQETPENEDKPIDSQKPGKPSEDKPSNENKPSKPKSNNDKANTATQNHSTFYSALMIGSLMLGVIVLLSFQKRSR